MVLLVLVLGLILAICPTPVLRLAGGRTHSANAVRVVGIGLAVVALLTVLVIGP